MKKNLLFLSLLFFLTALSANAVTSSFANPLGPNMGTVDKVIVSLQGYLNAVAGTIAIVFVLIGATMYIIASFGKKELAELGKKMIVVAVGGFAIIVAAPVIYKEIKGIVGGDVSNVATTRGAAVIVYGALKGFLLLVGLYAVLGFLIGGISYFISFGDEKRMDRAKRILKFTLIGTVVAFGALVISAQIMRLFGG